MIGDDNLGKIMVLMFNDNEEDVFHHIMSYVKAGAKSFTFMDTPKDVLSFEKLEIDESRHIVIKNNSEIELTFIEFEILLLLAQNAGTVFSKEQIYDIVWKEPYSGDYNIVMSHIRNIRENQEIELTYTEFEIFKLLAKHPGIVFSKERIYDIVWKESYSGDYNIVMSHIRNIREKIEDNPSKPIYIRTVWRVGYRFNKNLIA